MVDNRLQVVPMEVRAVELGNIVLVGSKVVFDNR